MGRAGGVGQVTDCRAPRRRGFTLTEMLAALGILVALMAVAFPAVASVQRSLRLMQLDATAQQIYNATQSRLTALKAAGRLSADHDKKDYLVSEISPSDQTVDSSVLTDYPASVSATQAERSNADIYYLLVGDAGLTDYLFSPGSNNDGNDGAATISSNLTSNDRYVVELSPTTGEVYAVFCWQESDADRLDDTSFYQAVRNYRSINRAASGKTYGYYGGHAVSKKVEVTKPQVDDSISYQVVNGEELYLRITSSLFGKASFDETNSTVSVILTQEKRNSWDTENTSTLTFTYQGKSADNKCFGYSAGDDEIDVILDSGRAGFSFNDIVNDGKTDDSQHIRPGANVRAMVTITYANRNDGSTTTQRVPCADSSNGDDAPFNTLFASYGNGGSTVTCNTVRHLANLDMVGHGLKAGDVGNYGSYTSVEVTGDVDFDGTTWNPKSVSCQSYQKVLNAGGTDLNPRDYLAPIVTSAQMNATGTNKFKGNSHTLRNFIIKSDSDSCGLLKTAGFSIENLTMANPTVAGTAHVGAITGQFTGAALAGCHVTTETGKSSSVTGTGAYVGGLVGMVNSGNATMTDCSSMATVSGTTYTGGIAGYSKGSSISKCYVYQAEGGTTITGSNGAGGVGDYVGGIVGILDQGGTTISECGSAASAVSGHTYVGGIVGYFRGSTVSSCHVYPAGDTTTTVIGSAQKVGGLVGAVDSSMSVKGCSSTADVIGLDEVGGLVGDGSAGASFDSCSVGYIRGDTSKERKVSITGTTGDNHGWNVGGLVGISSASITTCSVYADVSGYTYVGGIAGKKYNGSVTDATVGKPSASVTVGGTGDCVGGLFGGLASSSLGRGVAYVSVSGGNRVGGLVGNCESSTIWNCEARSLDGASANVANNAAKKRAGHLLVKGTGDSVGGAIGYRANGDVTNCVAEVQVSGKRVVGGFVGYSEGGSTSGCSSHGVVTDGRAALINIAVTEDCAGGFVGLFKSGNTWNCSSEPFISYKGTDSNGRYNGGFAGSIENGQITGSCASGVVYGCQYIGGFAGYAGGSAYFTNDLTTTRVNVWSSTRKADYAGGFFGRDDSSSSSSSCASYSRIVYNPNMAEVNHVNGFVGYSTKSSYDSNSFYLSDGPVGSEGFNTKFGYSPCAQPGTRTFAQATVANPTGETYPEKCTAPFPYDRVGVSVPFYGDWATGVKDGAD